MPLTNLYSGRCAVCARYVPAGAGHTRKAGRYWRVDCLACSPDALPPPDARPAGVAGVELPKAA